MRENSVMARSRVIRTVIIAATTIAVVILLVKGIEYYHEYVEPRNQIDNFLHALERRDYKNVYDMSSNSYRGSITFAQHRELMMQIEDFLPRQFKIEYFDRAFPGECAAKIGYPTFRSRSNVIVPTSAFGVNIYRTKNGQWLMDTKGALRSLFAYMKSQNRGYVLRRYFPKSL